MVTVISSSMTTAVRLAKALGLDSQTGTAHMTPAVRVKQMDYASPSHTSGTVMCPRQRIWISIWRGQHRNRGPNLKHYNKIKNPKSTNSTTSEPLHQNADSGRLRVCLRFFRRGAHEPDFGFYCRNQIKKSWPYNPKIVGLGV